MATTISSRTPEGVPNHCPVCEAFLCVEPSQPPGDAPCPRCGTLLWFLPTSGGMRVYESEAVGPLRDRILARVYEALGVSDEQVAGSPSFLEEVGADSLDVVELVME